MTRPRSTLVSPSDTPYYHCIGRCVRRAFLCGKDPVSGKSFDHRKQRILERLTLLTEVFAIELCAYALMSNHYHLVLRLAPEKAAAWTEREVVERWRRLYAGPPCLTRYLDGAPLDASESALLADCLPRWRSRLVDLSWFMRCLNEFIARLANKEDGCTGRFWEGRFKSQALLDEQALLTVMAYVDLNPVRAGLVESIEASEFTSGQRRLKALTQSEHEAAAGAKPALLPFAQALRQNEDAGLPFNLQDYLELLDTSGRVMHPTKHGAIPETTPRLLSSLGLEPGEWLKSVAELHARFRLFIGAPHRLSLLAERHGWRWIRGQRAARRLYGCVNE
ncbi:MAG TPA: transposase [Gammaproteobacteria bacterium]|nr:transposase [Gammaproteobacteria bacterium]